MKQLLKRVLAVVIAVAMIVPNMTEIVMAATENLTAIELTVSGEACVGETLHAMIGGEVPTGVNFEWSRSDSPDDSIDGTVIDGATGSSYELTPEDEGKYIYVKIFGDGVNYSEDDSAVSVKTAQVIPTVIEATELEPAEDAEYMMVLSDENELEMNDELEDTVWNVTQKIVTSASGMGGYAVGSVLSVLGVDDMSKCFWYRLNEKPDTVNVNQLRENGELIIVTDNDGNPVTDEAGKVVAYNDPRYTTTKADLNKYIFAVYEIANDPKTADNMTKQYVSDIYENRISDYKPSVGAIEKVRTSEGTSGSDIPGLVSLVSERFDPSSSLHEDMYSLVYDINTDMGVSFDFASYTSRTAEITIDLPSASTGNVDFLSFYGSDASMSMWNAIASNRMSAVFSDNNTKLKVTVPMEFGGASLEYYVQNVKVNVTFRIREKNHKAYFTHYSEWISDSEGGRREYYVNRIRGRKTFDSFAEADIAYYDYARAQRFLNKRINSWETVHVARDGRIVPGVSVDIEHAYFDGYPEVNASQCISVAYVSGDVRDIKGLEFYLNENFASISKAQGPEFATEGIIVPVIVPGEASPLNYYLPTTNAGRFESPLLIYEREEDIAVTSEGRPDRSKAISLITLKANEKKDLYIAFDVKSEDSMESYIADIYNKLITSSQPGNMVEYNKLPYGITKKECLSKNTDNGSCYYFKVSFDAAKVASNSNANYIDINLDCSDTMGFPYFLYGRWVVKQTDKDPILAYTYDMSIYQFYGNYLTVRDDLVAGVYSSKFELQGLSEGEKLLDVSVVDKFAYDITKTGTIYGDVAKKSFTSIVADNTFKVKMDIPDVYYKVKLTLGSDSEHITRSYFVFLSTFTDRSTEGAEPKSDAYSNFFYLDDYDYHYGAQNSDTRRMWGVRQIVVGNTTRANKTGEREFGVQFTTALNNAANGIAPDVEKYIKSVNVSVTGSKLGDITDATAKNAVNSVAWFLDDEGNKITKFELPRSGTGYLSVPMYVGHNTGTISGRIALEFKNEDGVPRAVRGNTYYQNFTVNVVNKPEVVGELADPVIEPDWTDDAQENFRLFKEYYSDIKDYVDSYGEMFWNITLPDGVTFDGQGEQLHVDNRINLSSSYEYEGFESATASLDDDSYPATFRNTSFVIDGSADTGNIFSLYGIRILDCNGLYVVSGDSAQIDNCYISNGAGSVSNALFTTKDGAVVVRNSVLQLSDNTNTTATSLIELSGVGANDSVVEMNEVAVGTAGSSEKPIVQNNVNDGNGKEDWLKFIIQDNTFVNATGAHKVLLSNQNSEAKFYAARNRYDESVKLDAAEMYERDGISSAKGMAIQNSSNTYAVVITADYKGDNISYLGTFANKNSTNMAVELHYSGISEAATEQKRLNTAVYSVESESPLYVVSQALDKAVKEGYEYYDPSITISDSDAVLAKKITAGYIKYKVVTFRNPSNYMVDTSFIINDSEFKNAGSVMLFRIDSAGNVTGSPIALAASDGDIQIDKSYLQSLGDTPKCVVAAYNNVPKLVFGECDGHPLDATIYSYTTAGDGAVPGFLYINPTTNGEFSFKGTLTKEQWDKITVTCDSPGLKVRKIEEGDSAFVSGNYGMIYYEVSDSEKIGTATITVKYVDGKYQQSAVQKVAVCHYEEDTAGLKAQGLRPGSKYATASVNVKGVTTSTTIKNWGVAGGNDNIDNLRPVECKAEKLSDNSGIKYTITFDISDINEYVYTNTDRVWAEVPGGQIDTHIWPYIAKVVEQSQGDAGTNYYEIRSINGEDVAVFVGSSVKNDVVVIPESVSYKGNDDAVTVPVKAISAGSMNASVDGNNLSVASTAINIGKNVQYIGVDLNNLEDVVTPGYYGAICDGSGEYSRLEKIYVDADNTAFAGTVYDPGVSESGKDDFNLYSKSGKVIYEYPVFSKISTWKMPAGLSAKENVSKLSVNDEAFGGLVKTQRGLTKIVVSNSGSNCEGIVAALNTGLVESIEVYADANPLDAYDTYVSRDGVLCKKDAEGLSILQYPANKKSDAIFINGDGGKVAGITLNALTANTNNNLVISAQITGYMKVIIPGRGDDETEILGGEGKNNDISFNTNANQIYIYSANFDDWYQSMTAPKGASIYLLKDFATDADIKAWASQKGYKLVQMGTGSWTLAGRNTISNVAAGAEINSLWANANDEIKMSYGYTAQDSEGNLIAPKLKYMYLTVGDVFVPGDNVSGISYKQSGANNFSSLYDGQVEYSTANMYNELEDSVLVNDARIFGEQGSGRGALSIGSSYVVKHPGVEALTISVDGEIKETILLVAKPRSVSVPATLTQTGFTNASYEKEGHTGTVLLEVTSSETDNVKWMNAMKSYDYVGLMTHTTNSGLVIYKEVGGNAQGAGLSFEAKQPVTANVQLTTVMLGTTYITTLVINPLLKSDAIAINEVRNTYNILGTGLLYRNTDGIERDGIAYPKALLNVVSNGTAVSKDYYKVSSSDANTLAVVVLDDNTIELTPKKTGSVKITVTMLESSPRTVVLPIKVVDSAIASMSVSLIGYDSNVIESDGEPAGDKTGRVSSSSANQIKLEYRKTVFVKGFLDSIDTVNETSIDDDPRYSLSWSSSDTGVMSWNAKNKGFDVKNEGTTVLTAALMYNGQADPSGLKQSFNVNVVDPRIRLENSAVTVSNKSLVGARINVIVPDGKEWELKNKKLYKLASRPADDSDDPVVDGLKLEAGEDYINIIANSAMKAGKGTYYIGVDDYRLPVTVTVNTVMPAASNLTVTVPKFDYFHWTDEQDPIQISLSNGYSIDETNNIYLSYGDPDAFEVVKDDGSYRLTCREDIKSKVSTRGYNNTITFYVPVDGFAEEWNDEKKPSEQTGWVAKTVTLNLVNGEPKAVLNKTVLTVDGAVYNASDSLVINYDDSAEIFGFNDVNGTVLMAADKNTQNLCVTAGIADYNDIYAEGDLAFAKFSQYLDFEIESGINNVVMVKAGEKVPDGTYNFNLVPATKIGSDGEGDIAQKMSPVAIRVVIKSTKATMKFSTGTVAINPYQEKVDALTILTPNKKVDFDPDKIIVTMSAAPKGVDLAPNRIITNFVQNADGTLAMKVRPADRDVIDGAYKLSVWAYADRIDGGESHTYLPAVTLTVNVKRVQPKVTLSETTVTLDNLYVDDKSNVITLNAEGSDDVVRGFNVYRVASGGESIVTYDANEPVIETNAVNGGIMHIVAKEGTLAGTYTYYIAPLVQVGGSDCSDTETELSRQKITVKVTSSRPVAKAKATTLTVNNYLMSGQSASTEFTVADTDISEFVVTGNDTKGVAQTLLDTDAVVFGNNGNELYVQTKNPQSLAKGSYSFKVIPMAPVRSRNETSVVALTPVVITLKVDTAKATLALNSNNAEIFTKFSDGVTLTHKGDEADIASVVPSTKYINKHVSGKTVQYEVEDTEGSECYAIVSTAVNGGISVKKGKAVNYLTKDLTISNLIIPRTLNLAQIFDDDVVYTDTQKININFRVGTAPTPSVDKATLNLNSKFDFIDGGSYKNEITLKTNATMNDGEDGAYITLYSMSISGKDNQISVVPVDYDGTRSKLDFKVVPMTSKPANGTYTVKITPYVSTVKFNDPMYNSSALTKLKDVTFKVVISDADPKVTYSATSMSVNARDTSQARIINVSAGDTEITELVVNLKSKPQNATGDELRVSNAKVDDKWCVQIEVADDHALNGSYVYEVVPYVRTVNGDIALTKQNITLNVTNQLPTAALNNATLRINTNTDVVFADGQKYIGTIGKVNITGALANNVSSVVYEAECLSVPKGAQNGDVFIRQMNNYSFIAYCNTANAVPGTYKLQINTYAYGPGVALDGIKPMTLSVIVSNTNPKVTLSKNSTTLNTYYEQEDTDAYMNFSAQCTPVVEGFEIAQTAYPVNKAKESTRDAVSLRFITDPTSGRIHIGARTAATAMTGTYAFSVTPVIKSAIAGEYIRLTPVVYKVNVVKTIPTYKMSSSKLALNTQYTDEEATATLILDNAATVESAIDTEATLKTLTYTGNVKTKAIANRFIEEGYITIGTENGVNILSVCSHGEEMPVGSYTYSMIPAIRTQSGQTISLSKLNFTVNVENKAPGVAMKAMGGKLDLASPGVSKMMFTPSVTGIAYDKTVASADNYEVVGQEKGTDYSGFFEIVGYDSDKDLLEIGFNSEAIRTGFAKGTYPVRIRTITNAGKKVYTDVKLSVVQSASGITMTPANPVLYKKEADSSAPVVTVNTSALLDDIVSAEVLNNVNFEVESVLIKEAEGTDGKNEYSSIRKIRKGQYVIKIKFAGIQDANSPVGGTPEDRELAAKSRTAYKNGETVTVPIRFTLEGGATETVNIKITVKN